MAPTIDVANGIKLCDQVVFISLYDHMRAGSVTWLYVYIAISSSFANCI